MTRDEKAPDSVPALLERLEDAAQNDRPITLGYLLELFGARAYGPLILIPSLLALGPTGVIPGMAVGTATIIILAAGQILLLQDHPWLPKRILEMRVKRSLLAKAIEKSRPVARVINRVTRQRLAFATSPPALYAVAIMSIALAALFYPLAFIPFGVAIPSFVLTVLSLGLTIRDGAVVLAAMVMGLGAFAGSLWLLLS
jgi:hypothetical protein